MTITVAKQSGYLAAVTAIAWTSGQGINSLTDNEWTDLSDEIDNSTNKYLFVDLFLELGSAAFTGTDSIIEAYLVRSIDGTKYPEWTGNGTADEQENNQYFVGSCTTTGATATQDLNIEDIRLPPGKYKWGFRNKSGVTLNASNTVEWRPYSLAGDDA